MVNSVLPYRQTVSVSNQFYIITKNNDKPETFSLKARDCQQNFHMFCFFFSLFIVLLFSTQWVACLDSCGSAHSGGAGLRSMSR